MTTHVAPTPSRAGTGRKRWHRVLLFPLAIGFCLSAVFLVAVLSVSVQERLKPVPVSFLDAKPAIGDPAPDFLLKDAAGKEYRLSDHFGRMPVVLEFGSATCPYCVYSADGMEDLAKRYAGKAEFVFVYCKEAHPDMVGMRLPGGGKEVPTIPQTNTREERAPRAEAYCSASQPTARVLVDEEGPSSVQKRYGCEWNEAFVIDTEGRVVLKQGMTDARKIGDYLAKELGAAASVIPGGSP